MNKEYWEAYWNFTGDGGMSQGRSPFCIWVIEHHSNLISNINVVDMCCGNGRDSVALERWTDNFTAVDISGNPHLMRKTSVFCKQTIKDFCANNKPPDTLYCRFGFHSIEEEDENILLDWCEGCLVAEMRSSGGRRPDHTHERRLIDPVDFFIKLYSKGFQVTYFSESYGYATTDTEDPKIIRLIASKR